MPRLSLLLPLLAACSGGLRFGVDEPFPEKLSELGLEEANDVVAYAPANPLWTNGLDKDRLLWLPPRTTIDTSKEDWAFPEGAALFKTFSWEGDPVETRAMRLGVDGWEYATYQWKGNDADLLDGALSTPVDGIEHSIPSTLDCRTCHEPGGGVIGLRDLQLTDKDAKKLADLTEPKASPLPVEGPDDLTTEVLRYFVGNCAHCHDGEQGDQHSFSLAPDVAVDNVVNVPTDANATAPGTRVVPGAPHESILFLAVSEEHENNEIRAMPPLGVQRLDSDGIELLRAWIEGM